MAPDNITIMEGLLSHANESGVIEYKGINPGKTIAFIACIHGNEIA
ncbi:MAG TPA: hypothetical protein PK765_07550 [bacterium]|nr:hypothetical protein [bacterium]